MGRIAIPVASSVLKTAFAEHPLPWSITKRWPMVRSGGQSAEVRDAKGGHMFDCDVLAAEAVVALAQATFVCDQHGAPEEHAGPIGLDGEAIEIAEDESCGELIDNAIQRYAEYRGPMREAG